MRDFTPKTVCKSLICFLMLYFSAHADYHYASHTGSNTYPYTTWETAADSVQKAINSATADDTVYVGEGLWEDGPYNLWDSLSLIGMGMDSTTIRKTGFIDILNVRNETLIQGFTWDGVDPALTNSAIHPILGSQNVNIDDNKFIHFDVAFHGGELSGEITNNIFAHNGGTLDATFGGCNILFKNNSVSDNGGGGIAVIGGRWFIQNNLFAHNGAGQFILMLNVGFQGDTGYVANNLFYKNQEGNQSFVSVATLSPITVCENNTFVGPQPNSMHVAIANYLLPVALKSNNNINTDFYSAFYNVYSDDSVNVFYNDLWQNQNVSTGRGPTILGEGNIFQNPMFNNLDSGDVRFQMHSPCIDAGDPIIFDYDGSRSDMGAFGGPGGYFYQYLDLPPRTPDSLSATISGDSIIINWRMSTEADFYRYIINRDTISGFTPWAGNIVSEPDTSNFIDTNWDHFHNYYYKIAAYDNQFNLSPYSQELGVLVTSIDDHFNPLLPQMTEISTNYPNPFNGQTTISYYLADIGYQPAEVKLYMYNISGQLVRKLIDIRQYPGSYKVVWDGLGEGGGPLSSGIYFARLIVSGIELQRARKIILLK